MRDGRRAWEFAVACEEAAEVLDDKLLLLVDVEDWSRIVCWASSKADIVGLGSAHGFLWETYL